MPRTWCWARGGCCSSSAGCPASWSGITRAGSASTAAADRIAADRAAMAALPPIAESSLGWHNRIRLPRDHYVRIDTCDYSVDPAVIGRMVAVRADLEQVRVT